MILHSFKKIFSFIAALIILIVFFWAHDSIANGNSTKLNDLLKSLEISQPNNSQNKEAILFESYKDYFGMFISFYEEKLDGKTQKKMSLRKKTADAILEFVNNGNASATSMQATNTLKRILAENKARQLNEEIYVFLKNHPLSYTFSGIKALMDFDKAFGKP